MPTVYLQPPAPSSQGYPIVIEPNATKLLPKLIEELGTYDQVIILYDENLGQLAASLHTSIENAHLISVPSGEESKTLFETQRIVSTMLDCGASRQSLLINLGGGMLTDLGGFVGSVFMRGIDFVHVSTSLLGMVDASIGGKTGVDVGTVKNIVGTFCHPRAIVIDTDVLCSLPEEQLREGLVEVIKMAATLSIDDFVWLEENIDAVLQRDQKAVQGCIERAVHMKLDVVKTDEKEAGRRKLLNFGHTIGHCLEAESNFALSHGKAVSIGMVAEMQLSDSAVLERVVELLERIDMPTEYPEGDADSRWQLMLSDKKSSHGKVYMAVPTTLGNGEVQELKKEQFLCLSNE